jgi:hypothetical protein
MDFLRITERDNDLYYLLNKVWSLSELAGRNYNDSLELLCIPNATAMFYQARLLNRLPVFQDRSLPRNAS